MSKNEECDQTDFSGLSQKNGLHVLKTVISIYECYDQQIQMKSRTALVNPPGIWWTS